MKAKNLLALLLGIGVAVGIFAYNYTHPRPEDYGVGSYSNGSSIDLRDGSAVHTFEYHATTGATTCKIVLQSSSDGKNWHDVGSTDTCEFVRLQRK